MTASKEIAIVLGETFPDLARQYYGDGSKFGVKITIHLSRQGTWNSTCCKPLQRFLREDNFVVYLGDNMFQNGIGRYAESFLKMNPDALLLLKEVENPSRFGVAQLDKNNRVIRLVEKPKQPPSKYAVVGVYFFKPTVFDALKEVKPSWRNELEITDTIQILIDRGYDVACSFVEGWWVDTGKKDDILQVNALILDERMTRDVRGVLVNSTVEGRVSVGEGTRLVNSTVRGPSIIGRNCRIENSYIAPYTV